MKRVLTALLLAPAALYLVFSAHSWALLGAATLIASWCFVEYRELVARHGLACSLPLGLATGWLGLILPLSQWATVLILAALASLALHLGRRPLSTVLPSAASLTFGVLYIFGPWRAALELRGHSSHWLFFALATGWIGDIAAYYAGTRLGRHKLAPELSPQKTWEGSAASLLASALFGTLYLTHFLALKVSLALLLSLVANLAGQLGDLAESALKRGAGVKDSGSWLPGHGGWLDRLDSNLFTLPLVYVVVDYWL